MHESVKSELLSNIKVIVAKQFGGENKSFQNSSDYSRIVNQRHQNRLSQMLEKTIPDGAQLFMGGEVDNESNYIAPTILTEVGNDSPVMSEEIFGTILPVITYNHLSEAMDFINARPKPLG